MSVRDEIESTFRRVAGERGRRLAPFTDDMKLSESGLDSLSFMLVIFSLEESFEVDPFDSVEPAEYPVTLRELIELYERHVV